MMANELDALESENKMLQETIATSAAEANGLDEANERLREENTELQRKFDALMEAALCKQERLDDLGYKLTHELLEDAPVVCMTEEKWAEVKGENKQLKFGMAHATAVISKQADSISELIAENERLHEALTEINNGLKSEHTH